MKSRLYKVLALVGIWIISIITPCYAFGGYAHWYMARQTGSTETTKAYENYAGGCLLADIGKSSWDDDYTDSDGNSFTKKIIALAEDGDNKTETWTELFAYGWRSHYTQDNKGSLANIKTTKTWTPSYRGKCGWVDEYLRDSKNISCPINGTDTIKVRYSLIRDTYEALDGFSPTNSQINNEIDDMYSLYDVQIALNTYGWTSSEKKSIIKELNRTANLCSTEHTASISRSNESQVYANDVSKEKTITSQFRKKIKNDIKAKLQEIRYANITRIDSQLNDDGSYTLKRIINDTDAYNIYISEIVADICSTGYTFDQIYNTSPD